MKPAMGMWYSTCCIEDLYAIESEAELAEVQSLIEEDEPPVPRVWQSLADALADPWVSQSLRDVSGATLRRLGLHPWPEGVDWDRDTVTAMFLGHRLYTFTPHSTRS